MLYVQRLSGSEGKRLGLDTKRIGINRKVDQEIKARHTALLIALPWNPVTPHACSFKRRIRRMSFGLQRIAVPANAALMAAGGISRVHEEDSFEALLRWLAFQLLGVSACCL